MPEIKIVTEVAGRVCALPVATGDGVGEGDEIAFVEAMKMEIPVVVRRRQERSRRSMSSSTTSSPKARSLRSSKLNRITA